MDHTFLCVDGELILYTLFYVDFLGKLVVPLYLDIVLPIPSGSMQDKAKLVWCYHQMNVCIMVTWMNVCSMVSGVCYVCETIFLAGEGITQ